MEVRVEVFDALRGVGLCRFAIPRGIIKEGAVVVVIVDTADPPSINIGAETLAVGFPFLATTLGWNAIASRWVERGSYEEATMIEAGDAPLKEFGLPRSRKKHFQFWPSFGAE